MIVSFEVGREGFEHPLLIGAWTVLVGVLMVSKIPTFGFKRLRVPDWMVLPILLVVGAVAAGLAAEPWITLMLLGAVYIGSLPVAFVITRDQRHAARTAPPAEHPAPPGTSDAAGA